MTERGLLTDSVTVLRARGRRLTKAITSDGRIDDYNSARVFDLFAVPVDGLDKHLKLLGALSNRSDCCVVRGAIADPANTRGVRRLVHADSETGDQPTLIDVPRRWLALDVDDLERPATIAASDLTSCAAVALRALPLPFQGAACIAQATAGHGIKPGIRMRLWFWLGRATTGIELRRWLRGVPVDHSVFRAAQPVYTATPVFCAGATDPLGERTVLLPGAMDVVRVPSSSTLMTPPRRPVMEMTVNGSGISRYGFAALCAATARVMRAADGARHPTLLAEATGLSALVSRNHLTAKAVADALCGAAGRAGLPEQEAADVIAWALARLSGQPAGATP